MQNSTLKILLADDDPAMLSLISSLLSEAGYNVITAENGIEALEKAKTEFPSLILLDIHMPKMDGLETCRQLKEYETTKMIPVIMLTVAGQMSEIEKAMMYGARTYITKPCTKEQILTTVKDF